MAGAFLGCFGVTARICWPLRKQLWFWLVMVALGVLHLLALVLFDWSAAADWKGPTVMPFMLADIALLLTLIYFIFRFLYGAPAQVMIEPDARYADDGLDI